MFADTTFVNNLTINGVSDSTNAGLNFTLPTRLEASVTLTNNMTGGGVVTFSGSIYDNPFNGAASLICNGRNSAAGPVVFSGSNAYRGTTTVASGTLAVNNTFGSGTGTGPVAVNGGTLQGTGFIFPAAGNNVTVAAGGTLQPGSSTAVGTLTMGTPAVPTNVALNGTFLWNNSAAGSSSSTLGGSGGTVSKLVVNGNLTFAPATFSINGIGSTTFDNTQPYSWTVATATGTITLGSQPTFNTTNFAPSAVGSFFLSTSGNSVFVSYTPVPEPATMLLVCAGTFGATSLLRRYRRRSKEMTVSLPV